MTNTPNFSRMHRYRKHAALRDMLAEHHVRRSDFIYPIFVKEDLTGHTVVPVPSLPSVSQYSLDAMIHEVERAVNKGIRSIILFGIPKLKDEAGSSSFDDEGIVQRSIRAIKQRFPNLYLIADVCMCGYTSHGHCGIVDSKGLNNDQTLDVLNKIALSYAEAGVDCLAPSGMIDGTVSVLRHILDIRGFVDISIMNYGTKYSSSLYGPFRDASGVSSEFKGDRKGYQISPSQFQEGIQESLIDQQEGVDFVIVKPAAWYLDVIYGLKQTLNVPIVGYHVSGEYSMIKAAAAQGWVNENEAFLEVMLSLKRAGCSLIISYAALELDIE